MLEPVRSDDITIPEYVRETANEDGAVLLDPEQGICFSLNPVGLKIWDQLKQHRSVGQIADTLAAEFNVPRNEILNDIAEFLAELEAKHLLYHGKPPLQEEGWLRRILPWRKQRAS